MLSRISKSLCLTFLFITIFFFNNNAQNIIPSERVQDRVIVRKEPNTHSEIIGSLKKGESSKLLQDVPYWYKIELSNLAVGYVSKAWTKISDTLIVTIDSLRKTDLIIGSWNIKWFGRGAVGKHNYSEMAKIISKMDVAALQELMDPNCSKELDSIKFYLGQSGYKFNYVISNLTGYVNNPEPGKSDYLERYGFIWDIDRIDILNASSPLTFTGSPVINNPKCRQVPVYADFKVKDGEGFDFRIMTIHTVYNKNINYVRKSELEFVNQWLIDQSADPGNTEKNVIVIGDFNANPDGQPHHFKSIISGSINYRVLFEESLAAGEKSLRTTIQQSDNPGTDYFLLPVYDHALVSNETSYALPHNPMTKASKDLGVIEFDQDSLWKNLNNWNQVISRMSDHRPIWFKLDYNAEDRD
ncbi:MAG: SH3 domain-containing protein [Ignavibacteria bacterium]